MIIPVLMTCSMIVCTVDVFLLPELPGTHPPVKTVEEEYFCAVYRVHGQELCLAFIIAAKTQNRCC